MESVKVLVAAGADVNQPSADGSSPLLVAVQNGFYSIAQFLIDNKANVNLTNNKGWSPLYLAVKNRNQEITAVPGPSTDGVLEFITLLLDKGANPNVRIKAATEVHQAMTAAWLKEEGATPLLRAALCGDLTVVRLLIDHGADPLIANQRSHHAVDGRLRRRLGQRNAARVFRRPNARRRETAPRQGLRY